MLLCCKLRLQLPPPPSRMPQRHTVTVKFNWKIISMVLYKFHDSTVATNVCTPMEQLDFGLHINACWSVRQIRLIRVILWWKRKDGKNNRLINSFNSTRLWYCLSQPAYLASSPGSSHAQSWFMAQGLE